MAVNILLIHFKARMIHDAFLKNKWIRCVFEINVKVIFLSLNICAFLNNCLVNSLVINSFCSRIYTPNLKPSLATFSILNTYYELKIFSEKKMKIQNFQANIKCDPSLLYSKATAASGMITLLWILFCHMPWLHPPTAMQLKSVFRNS